MPRRRRQFAAVSAITGDRLPSALSRVLDSAVEEAKGHVHGDYDRIAAITDPFELLRAASERLADAQQEVGGG